MSSFGAIVSSLRILKNNRKLLSSDFCMFGHLPSRVSFMTRSSVVSSSVAFSTSSRVIAFGIALVIMNLTYSSAILDSLVDIWLPGVGCRDM